MSTTALSAPTPNFYVRSLNKALSNDNEAAILSQLVMNTFDIARDVLANANQVRFEAGAGALHRLPFKVTKELWMRIFGKCVEETSLSCPSLNQGHVQRVRTFLNEYTLPAEDSFLQKTDFETRYVFYNKIDSEYLQKYYGFQKIELQQECQDMSCFSYAVWKSGITAKGDTYETNMGIVPLLKTFGYQQASLPLQSKDILVHYSQGKAVHAAAVAENTNEVYAKWGNDNPFAYKHKIEDTPAQYGKHYQILRKSVKTP